MEQNRISSIWNLYCASGFRRKLWIHLAIAAVLIGIILTHSYQYTSSLTTTVGAAEDTESTDALETVQNRAQTSVIDVAEYYAGCFSATVVNSVNPIATMTVLAAVGTFENSDRFFPETQWAVNFGTKLGNVPVFKLLKTLPIANPAATIVLFILTVIMFVMCCITALAPANKLVQILNSILGEIFNLTLTILPLATTEIAYAAGVETVAKAGTGWYMSAGTHVVLILFCVVFTILNTSAYVIINFVSANMETICQLIPVPLSGGVQQILEYILIGLLLVIEAVAPFLLVILCLFILLVAILLLPKMIAYATYFNYVYMKATWKFLFHRDVAMPRVHKKFPRKGRLFYQNANIDYAVPAITQKDFLAANPEKWKGRLKKHTLVWIASRDNVPYLVVIRPFHKVIETPLFTAMGDEHLHLKKHLRFLLVYDTNETRKLVISNEYAADTEELMKMLHIDTLENDVEAEAKLARKNARRASREE